MIRPLPCEGSALSWSAAALLLAAVAGFAIQKGGLCAVLAVRELIDERRASRFLAFLLCVAVVAAVVHPLRWLGLLDGPPAVHYAPAAAMLAGGMLFGIGAVVNGTCAFGSIAHLGRGETAFLALLPGLAAGYVAAERLPASLQPQPLATVPPLAQPELPALLIVVTATCVALAALLRLWRRRRPAAGVAQRLLRDRWPAPAAAALIGVASGVLYGAYGSWAYTEGLHRALHGMTSGRPATAVFDMALFAALLAGSVAGAAAQRTLRLRRPGLRQAVRSCIGGALMGAGAILIPGGNDALILHDMPDSALHAWLAYVVMCVAIGRALVFADQLTAFRRRRSQA